jgi:iron complex outermembrane receptor protein|tara:strand:+ start:1001 stop:2122 length:1122 start_codon:yes stop_codon:yes gene_type:complete
MEKHWKTAVNLQRTRIQIREGIAGVPRMLLRRAKKLVCATVAGTLMTVVFTPATLGAGQQSQNSIESSVIRSSGTISAQIELNDHFATRFTTSTRLHAVVPVQSNPDIFRATASDTGSILFQLDPIAEIDQAIPIHTGQELRDAEPRNISFGFVWDVTDDLNVTLDYFDIEVTNPTSQYGSNQVNASDIVILQNAFITDTGNLTEFSFYSNDPNVTSTGFDLVATYAMDWSLGTTDLNLAYNMTHTDLEALSSGIDLSRNFEQETTLPDSRWHLSGVHSIGNWRLLARLSYYSEWIEANDSANDMNFDEEYVLDVEASYTFSDRYTITVGAQNVLDDLLNSGSSILDTGSTYHSAMQKNQNGGYYYTQIRVEL